MYSATKKNTFNTNEIARHTKRILRMFVAVHTATGTQRIAILFARAIRYIYKLCTSGCMWKRYLSASTVCTLTYARRPCILSTVYTCTYSSTRVANVRATRSSCSADGLQTAEQHRDHGRAQRETPHQEVAHLCSGEGEGEHTSCGRWETLPPEAVRIGLLTATPRTRSLYVRTQRMNFNVLLHDNSISYQTNWHPQRDGGDPNKISLSPLTATPHPPPRDWARGSPRRSICANL